MSELIFDLQQRAEDLSAWMRPTRWHVFKYVHWRRFMQPEDFIQRYNDVLFGEREPIVRKALKS